MSPGLQAFLSCELSTNQVQKMHCCTLCVTGIFADCQLSYNKCITVAVTPSALAEWWCHGDMTL